MAFMVSKLAEYQNRGVLGVAIVGPACGFFSGTTAWCWPSRAFRDGAHRHTLPGPRRRNEVLKMPKRVSCARARTVMIALNSYFQIYTYVSAESSPARNNLLAKLQVLARRSDRKRLKPRQ